MLPEVTEALNPQTRRKPQENVKAITGEGLSALLEEQDETPHMLKSLGIKIVPKILSLPARWIGGPNILYKGDEISTALQGFWSLKNASVQFASTGYGFDKSPTPTAQFFYPANEMASPQYEPQYLDAFRRYHIANGLKQLRPHDGYPNFVAIQNWDDEGLFEKLKKYSGNLGLARLFSRKTTAKIVRGTPISRS